MSSLHILIFLTTFVCLDGLASAGSVPGAISTTYSSGRDKRLRVYGYGTSNVQFYVLSVYHASAGYVNSVTTTGTSIDIDTGICGRNYNLTITPFNAYGSGTPRRTAVSSGLTTPSMNEPQKNNLVATITWGNTCNIRHDLYVVDQNSMERKIGSVSSPYTFRMQSNMLYKVRVLAMYEIGERYSSWKYISTGWPGEVNSVSSVSAFHSLSFTWPVVEFADFYQINVSSLYSTTFNANTTTRTNKLDVHGVKAGRRYKLSIKAINKLGEGTIRTTYVYATPDVPLIQPVVMSRSGTAKIEWTKAQDNENYYLRIYDVNGASYYGGQVAGSVYTWKANSALVNAYAYVQTRDDDHRQTSNYLYFGNAASRPVITSVVRASGGQLRVAATTIGNAATYRIRIFVQTYYVRSDGYPGMSSRDSRFQATSPWLASAYHYPGAKIVYYVTVLTDVDNNGIYEACSDTFVYKQEPPTGVSSLLQSSTSSNYARITWSTPEGYVERYWVIATAVTGGEIITNTSTTSTYLYILPLKTGRYYSATVTAENPAGRGPSQNITVKTTMGSAHVSRVIQVSPYMAQIYVDAAPEAIEHVLFLGNNGTEERKTVTSGNNLVIHNLAGNLKLRIRIVAFYETGNTSSTYDFHAFCLEQQVGNHNFSRVPAGQVAYSKEKCASGRPNASAVCEIQKYGAEFRTFFSSPKSIECDFTIGNITSEASAITAYGAERLCRIFDVVTSKVSTIEKSDAEKILEYLENLANSDTKISSQGLKFCLLTTSHLTSFLRVHHDSEYAERLLRTIPHLFRHFDDGYYHHYHYRSRESRNIIWNSDNIFAQITDVPTYLVRERKADNFSISPEFLSLDGTGRPEYPMEIIIPFASVVSVHEQISRETECHLNVIRIVFFAHRDSTLFPNKSSVDWITFLEIGTKKRAGRMNATQRLLIRKSVPKLHNTSKSAPLSEFYCGTLDTKKFQWNKDGCSPVNGETERCECQQFGYYGILKNDIFSPSAPYQMQSYDVAGCTVVVASMICTIIFLLSKKKLRRQYDVQALLHVLFTSSISHVVYVSGISNTTPTAACVAVSWLLHFLMLCSWTWVSIYMYASCVSVDTEKTITRKCAYIGTALAYVLPLCIAVINGGITTMPSMTSPDRDYVCFVQSYSLYFALILPAAAEFLWILHSCFCIWKMIKKDRKFLSLGLAISMVWPLLTLITWCSGVTAAFTANDITRWIFFTINIIQAIILAVGNSYVWKESPEQSANKAQSCSTNANAENTRNPYGQHPMASDQATENHAYEDLDFYENVSTAGTHF